MDELTKPNRRLPLWKKALIAVAIITSITYAFFNPLFFFGKTIGLIMFCVFIALFK